MGLLDFTTSPNGAPNYDYETQMALARQLQQEGMQTTPIRSPWQGAARLAQALVGANNENVINKNGNAATQQMIAMLTGQQQLQPGAAPANPPPPQASTPTPGYDTAAPMPAGTNPGNSAPSAGQDAIRASANITGALPNLAGVRQQFEPELQDPAVALRLAAITQAEVGGQGQQAQQAFIESIFNRAAARGQTVAQTLQGDYFPASTYAAADKAMSNPQALSAYSPLVAAALKGSNVSNLATGNASGTVGFAGGPQTAAINGERFGIEGPDQKWAASLNAPGGQPTAPAAASPVARALLNPSPQPGQSPQYAQMLAIALNPSLPPQARQMAMGIVQSQMMPQNEVTTTPDGTTLLINKRTGAVQPIYQAPIKGVAMDAGQQMVNPVTGQPIGPGMPQPPANIPPGMSAAAMPNAPQPGPGAVTSQPLPPLGAAEPQPGAAPTAPVPGPPSSAAPQATVQQPSQGVDTAQTMSVPRVAGEDYLDKLRADPQWGPYAAQARAILRGDMPVPTGNAATKGVDQMIMKLVYAADPQFNASVSAARGAAIKDFTDGTSPSSTGGQILAANTALGHLEEAARASEELGKQQLGAGGWQEVLGAGQQAWNPAGPYSKALAKFEAARTPLVEELTKFYSGSSGTEAQRKALEGALDVNASPSVRAQAMGVLARDLQAKAVELQRKWHQSMGPNAQDFPIFGPSAAKSLSYINGLTTPQKAAPGTSAAPVTPPQIGTVIDGYRFKGGDPSNPASWEQQ